MNGKVGVAPGTLTMNLQPGGQLTLVGTEEPLVAWPPVNRQQDPGVVVRSQTGVLKGLDYFDARPTDFDLSKIYGYTPVARGWITGELDDACCGPCGVGEPLSGIDVGLEVGMTLGTAALGAALGAMALHKQGPGWAAAGAGAIGALLGYVGFRLAKGVPFVD
jgi:hypothetical protein